MLLCSLLLDIELLKKKLSRKPQTKWRQTTPSSRQNKPKSKLFVIRRFTRFRQFGWIHTDSSHICLGKTNCFIQENHQISINSRPNRIWRRKLLSKTESRAPHETLHTARKFCGTSRGITYVALKFQRSAGGKALALVVNVWCEIENEMGDFHS